MKTFGRFVLAVVLLGLASLSFVLRAADDLPGPIEALEQHGAEVLGSIDAPEGMRGYAARIDGRGLAAYVLPDGEHAIIGTLINSRGEDLTRVPLEGQLGESLPPDVWQALRTSAWIQDGRPDAEHVVYVFSDPNCPFCHMFWLKARPWILDGRVQLRHIMVGLLREDSAGKAAALLAAEDPEEALRELSTRGKESELVPLDPVPEDLKEKIHANTRLMAELGSMATPTVVYKDEEGNIQMELGVPEDEQLDEVMGGAL